MDTRALSFHQESTARQLASCPGCSIRKDPPSYHGIHKVGDTWTMYSSRGEPMLQIADSTATSLIRRGIVGDDGKATPEAVRVFGAGVEVEH